MIESNAFSQTPNLQTVIISNNSELKFISPMAFFGVKLLFEHVLFI